MPNFCIFFSQALEHLHISSECLSDQFDSLVLSLWDWQRKIFSRDLLFALTPTSWVARCLAWTRRYAGNLRPGQSICYSPPESNLKPGNKAKQSNKHFSKVYKVYKVTRFTRTRRYAVILRPGKSICYSPPERNLKPGNKANKKYIYLCMRRYSSKA